MSDKPTPAERKPGHSKLVYDKAQRAIVTVSTHGLLIDPACNAFQSSAARLNVNPIEFAEALSDGGIAEMVEALNAAKQDLALVAVTMAREPGSRVHKTLSKVAAILATLPKPETKS